MSRSRWLARSLLLVIVLGCDSNTGPGEGLTPIQESQLAAVIQDEVENDLDAMMIETGVTPSAAVMGPSVPVDGLAELVAPCVAPSNTADGDSDGIYTDATITYAAPPCAWTSRRGGMLSLTGSLRVTDPTPSAGLAVSTTLTGLTFTFTGSPVAARNYSVARTGTRNVSQSGAGVVAASNLVITRDFAGGDVTIIQKNWASTYMPGTGNALIGGQALPSGSFRLNGSISWTRGAESFSMDVTTPIAMVYLASCPSAQRLTAGELRADGRFNGRDGYLRIRWTACGVEPTVEFIAPYATVGSSLASPDFIIR